MSLRAFRTAAEELVRLAVYGTLSDFEFDPPRPLVLASAYSDANAQLRAGQKGFGLRLWVVGEAADSNATYKNVGIEVLVARHLRVEEDEALYTGSEMLGDQDNLTTEATWLALTGVQGFEAEPSIAAPERDGQVITYTVEMTVQLDPT